MKKKMIATTRMTYGTRRLVANDEFMASARDARILAAIGKAREAREPGKLPPPPAKLAKKGGDDMTALRAAYQEKMGKRAFHGWSAEELRKRMADAKI